MSEVQKIGFGAIDDTDDSLQSKQGGKFGLNTGFFTKLAFNANAGKDGSAGNAVDIEVMIGDKEFRRRIYDVTRVYDKDGNQVTDVNSPEFINGYNESMTQNMAVIIHAIKATGVSQQQINTALATPPANFVDWANTILALVPADYTAKPIDIFLEYQWQIADDQDRTYLQLPKNMKGGYFLSASVSGDFKEVNTWTEVNQKTNEEEVKNGLAYKDASDTIHPIKKSQSFMESPKAYQQIDGQDNAAQNAVNNAVPQGTNAKASTW